MMAIFIMILAIVASWILFFVLGYQFAREKYLSDQPEVVVIREGQDIDPPDSTQ
jgi:hypothetical protein